VPLKWRLSLVPTYEFQFAKIHAPADNFFRVHRLEIKASLPLFARFGAGKFVQ
jgi:hypothetical protein